MPRWTIAFACLALAACATPRPVAVATFTNPVIDADFPDPTVIRAGDGLYYAYATQTEHDGHWVNLQLARSADLVHWDYLGDALPVKPSWASKTQDFWAPHVTHQGKRYIMYYSAKPDTSDERHGLCLGIATASGPAGPFTDIGHPFQCGEGFINIDPMQFDDPATGKHWLYWGSGFGPIRVQQLAPDLISFAPGSAPTELVSIVKTDALEDYQKLVEGAWVHRRGGYYYLFFSGDNCCGARAHYAVMVARSKSATGPFELAPNKVVLERSARWFAPGHNSIITDTAGQDWIAYHAVDVRRPREKPADDINTRRIMLIDRILWRDGWPVIAGPSETPQPAPKVAR